MAKRTREQILEMIKGRGDLKVQARMNPMEYSKFLYIKQYLRGLVPDGVEVSNSEVVRFCVSLAYTEVMADEQK